jgi:hypothetical protein
MQAFASGDIALAFDTFMSGVCGDQYRAVMQASLGEAGMYEAVQQSSFFVRDEVRSVVASTFTEDDAAQVSQPVLLVEGGDSHTLSPPRHRSPNWPGVCYPTQRWPPSAATRT